MVLRRFSNVTALDARRSGYDQSVFLDHGHLDRLGASTLSVDVSDAIKRATTTAGGARQVRLPRFRHVPIAVTVEELQQSMALVRLPVET
jgi:hypothetical protein